MIAYQQSTGAVSGFIQRYMLANPQNTWDQMKEQLSVRFSDVANAQMALSWLTQTRQKAGETIHNYADRYCLWRKTHIIIKEEMSLKGS